MRLAPLLLAALLLAGCATPAAPEAGTTPGASTPPAATTPAATPGTTATPAPVPAAAPWAAPVRAPPEAPLGPSTEFDLAVLQEEWGPLIVVSADMPWTPTLVLEEGTDVAIRLRFDEGVHALALEGGPQTPATPEGEVELRFKAGDEHHGVAYFCPVHPDTMRGALWVAQADDAPLDAPVERIDLAPEGAQPADLTVRVGGVVTWFNRHHDMVVRFPDANVSALEVSTLEARALWFRSAGELRYVVEGEAGTYEGRVVVTGAAE